MIECSRESKYFAITILLIALSFALSSCGNGGGNGSTGEPYIYAELLAYSNPASGVASVTILDDSTGTPITGATVTMNSVTLAYNATDEEYQGQLSVAPGGTVTVSVTVGGKTYTASGQQFASYPVISNPATGGTWPIRCTNTVTWSHGSPGTDTFFGVGVLDPATEAVVWPVDGIFQIVQTTTTSYSIPGSDVSVGNREVVVGIAKSLPILAAAPGSEFIISGFSAVPISVANVTPPPVTIDVTPAIGGIAMATTQQFAATARYCDGATDVITTSVEWTSSDTGVATISITAGSVGRAAAVDHGTTTITASLGGVSGQAALTVYTYYQFAMNAWPEAVAVGDVTGDGRNDVVVTGNNDYKLYLFAQNSSGGLSAPISFATSAYGYIPRDVAIGDVNGDGKNEVVVANSWGNIEVFVQNGSGGLVSSATYTTLNSTQVGIADLNHDGRLDVVGVGVSGNTIDVFLQNGGGTLNSPVSYAVNYSGFLSDLELGDINNDGWTDIIVMSSGGLPPQIGVLTQKSDGTFNTAVYYTPAGTSIGIGDINGDGRDDLVSIYGAMCVLAQNNGGTLNPASCLSSMGTGAVEVGDVNADGRKDVVLVHHGGMGLGIYFQAADGSLSAEQVYTIPYGVFNPHSLAIGDINNDGRKDIVTLDTYKGLIVLYR